MTQKSIMDGFGDIATNEVVKNLNAKVAELRVELAEVTQHNYELDGLVLELTRENAALREENTDVGPIYAQLEFAERRLCGMELKYSQMEEGLARERVAHQETRDKLKEKRRMCGTFAAEIAKTRRRAHRLKEQVEDLHAQIRSTYLLEVDLKAYKEAHKSALETANRNADIANKARSEAARLRDDVIRAERKLHDIRRALHIAGVTL